MTLQIILLCLCIFAPAHAMDWMLSSCFSNAKPKPETVGPCHITRLPKDVQDYIAGYLPNYEDFETKEEYIQRAFNVNQEQISQNKLTRTYRCGPCSHDPYTLKTMSIYVKDDIRDRKMLYIENSPCKAHAHRLYSCNTSQSQQEPVFSVAPNFRTAILLNTDYRIHIFDLGNLLDESRKEYTDDPPDFHGDIRITAIGITSDRTKITLAWYGVRDPIRKNRIIIKKIDPEQDSFHLLEEEYGKPTYKPNELAQGTRITKLEFNKQGTMLTAGNERNDRVWYQIVDDATYNASNTKSLAAYFRSRGVCKDLKSNQPIKYQLEPPQDGDATPMDE